VSTSSAAQDRWTVTINGLTKIIPAPNVLVAMHRGISRIGLPDSEIQRLEVRRVQ
jgi:hypothetical protein